MRNVITKGKKKKSQRTTKLLDRLSLAANEFGYWNSLCGENDRQ